MLKKNLPFILLLLLATISCSLKRPEPASPLANEMGMTKNFFATKVLNKNTGKHEWEGKKFMCGWAPIAEIGNYAKTYLNHNVITNWHCNVVFSFNHDHSMLIGKLVDPSSPDKWKTAIQIPITRNYTREYKKDNYQRQTNEIVENSTKDHPSTRPLMDLNLKGIIFSELWYSPSFSGVTLTHDIADIEIDKKNGFLGFTLSMTDGVYGNLFESKYRFNFKVMTTNKKFESTPWHEKNTRHLNALHIGGKKIDGLKKRFVAAHWDKYKSHDVYLVGFPPKYYKLAKEVINDYNELFKEKVSTKEKPINHDMFIPKNGDHLKYAFDLRYTTLTWISDVETSLNAPLGMGTALADRITGEILWGGVTLWGGTIDYIIKSAAPNMDIGSAISKAHGLNWINQMNDNPFSFKYDFDFPYGLNPTPNSTNRNNFSNNLLAKLQHKTPLAFNKSIQPEKVVNLDNFLGKKLYQLETIHNNSIRKFNDFSFNKYFKNMISDNNQHFNSSELQEKINSYKSLAKAKVHSPICTIKVHDVYGDIISAKRNSNFDSEKATLAYIKDVIVHEFGHMVGMGHNMAENILPTVSAVINLNVHHPTIDKNNSELKELNSLKKIMQNPKTKYTVPEQHWKPLVKAAKENMTNYSTVMGYKHTSTDILFNDHTKIIPGPFDVQVLKYLYNQEYATYKYGDKDFTYYDVPATGQIPLLAPANIEDRSSRFVSYFPSCTDYEASFDVSPLCKRWDRGYDEKTLVEEYFRDIENLKDSKLIAKSEISGARSVRGMEQYLYSMNLRNMGRIRLFYDYMRELFKEEIESISHDVDALKNFSKECSRDYDKMENETLKNLFMENPKLKELCEINKNAVIKLGKILASDGVDFSKVDHNNHASPAGLSFGNTEASWKQIYGTYQVLSDLPFKMTALNTLTLSKPYSYIYGWMFNIDRYSHDDGGFLYSSLYPNEFSNAIKKAVQTNLKFSGNNSNKTILKRTALSLGYFLRQGHYENANDKFRFPVSTYLKKITNQTKFEFSYVAVLLNAVKMEGENAPPNRYSSFTATILDFNTGKESPAGEVYLLPDSSFIVKSAANTIIYPLGEISFYGDTEAFTWAYKVSYTTDDRELLSTGSVKNIFPTMISSALNSCIYGKSKNGLQYFFNKSPDADISNILEKEDEYIGFLIRPGIATSITAQEDFKESIQDNYKRYKNHFANDFPESEHIENTCFEALKGIGLTSASAAALNGFWMPKMGEFIGE